MPTTSQMLAEYPDILLQVLAELRGAYLDGADTHEQAIDLLPALPDEWTTGSLNGICARGAFELKFSWKNKIITDVEVLSKAGQICRIKAGPLKNVTSNGIKVNCTNYPDGSISFITKPGSSYKISKN